MAKLRSHTHIDRPANEVWEVVSDAGNISAWFPAIKTSSVTGNRRHCDVAGGGSLEEEIVTNDPELRRFQYRITGGMPVESHLGTVDVIDKRFELAGRLQHRGQSRLGRGHARTGHRTRSRRA